MKKRFYFKTIILPKHKNGEYKDLDDLMTKVKNTEKVTFTKFKDRNGIDLVINKYNSKKTINNIELAVLYQM